MDQEAKDYKKRLLELCWWMRGGISYTEMLELAVSDVAVLSDIIKSNLETTKKTGVNFI